MASQLSTKLISDYSRLFLVGDAFDPAGFRGRLSTNEQTLGFLRATSLPTRPLRAEPIEECCTSSPGDVVWLDQPAHMLLSDRLHAALAPFSGWKGIPTILADASNRERQYYLLTVTGRAGPADFSRSLSTIKRYPKAVTREFAGLYFKDDSWSGEDVFMLVENTSFIFVTDPVKNSFDSLRIRNVTFTALTDVRFDEPTVEVLRQRGAE